MGITEPKNQAFTLEEKLAFDHARKTRKKTNGRYEMEIPWRQCEPSFENNYELALSRLKVQAIKDYGKKGSLQRSQRQTKASDSLVDVLI